MSKKLAAFSVITNLIILISIRQAYAFTSIEQSVEPLEIERIVVQAQKRGEDLQEVPVALSVLNGNELERGNMQTIQDIQHSVPNLSMVVTSPFATTLNMRGIPSNPNGVFNSGTSPGLGVYVDGVVYSRASGFNQDLSNIEQIEVLRGPQGTLFGQNTNLGVISITTKKPSEEVEAKVKVDIGNLALKRVNAYFTGPLAGDWLMASVSLFDVKSDGYIENVNNDTRFGGQDRSGGRAQLRILPADAWKIDFNVEFLKGRSTPPVQSLTDYGLGLGYIGLLGQGTTPEQYYTDDIRKVNLNSEEVFSEQDNVGVDTTVSFESSGGFQFKSITAFKDYDGIIGLDADFTAEKLLSSVEGENNQQFTQEFQIISPSEKPFRYVTGVYYLDNKSTNTQDVGTTTGIFQIPTGLPVGYPQALSLLPGAGVVPSGTLQTTSSALFANVNYDFSHHINTFFGLRYSNVEKQISFSQQGFATTIPGVYLLDYIDIPVTEQSKKDDFFSWTTGVTLTVNQNINLYGKISQGHKEGGYSFRPQSKTSIGGNAENPKMDFDKESVTSYEIGLKSDLLERRLRLNLAAFYLNYRDIQTRVVDENGVNRVINGPSATSQGIEGEVSYRINQSLTANINVGYADATFDDFTECHATYSCTGNQLPGAAKWTNSYSLKYGAEVSNNLELFAGIDYSYRSKIESDALNLAATQLGSSSLLNAQIGFVTFEGDWEIMLWSKNLLDEKVLVNRIDKASSDLSFSSELYAAPRTFGLSVSYYFF